MYVYIRILHMCVYVYKFYIYIAIILYSCSIHYIQCAYNAVRTATYKQTTSLNSVLLSRNITYHLHI